MPKNIHEIREPIHVFVRLDSDERQVLNSRPVQRLRHIHQLALTYLVYPGASHKRFEHSLGVMELAGRVFDVITRDEAVTDQIRSLIPEIAQPDKRTYWRRVLRMAALCHDVGHLPFSHAAEKELLPDDWDHERLTKEIILSEEMRAIWDGLTPPLRTDDIIKLSVGRKSSGLKFSNWEAILSEIIVGDAFGVDRIDYLLRDSHHIGVPYGRFDHYRLIDTLRVLVSPDSEEPVLGVEEGGLHTAEALALARYFMYLQVYFHHIRRIYDIHLKDFLKAWLKTGFFPTDIDAHLRLTDNEVTAALLEANLDSTSPAHVPARRIVRREHFHEIYRRNPEDVGVNPDAAVAVCEAMSVRYGEENVRLDQYRQRSGAPDFPVLTKDERVVSSISMSEVLRDLPVAAFDFVFVLPEKTVEAKAWLEANRSSIIEPKGGEE